MDFVFLLILTKTRKTAFKGIARKNRTTKAKSIFIINLSLLPFSIYYQT